MTTVTDTRSCFRDPIPDFVEACRLLDDAVTSHLSGNNAAAERLIREANMPILRSWLESVWGANSPYVQYRIVPNAPQVLSRSAREEARMPSHKEEKYLHLRDGFHCRFCGLPVIRSQVRQAMARAYPDALPWGRKNADQHAAFQAMWVQYDHIVPHARGGTNDLENIVVACSACNYGRMSYLLEEVGISDPRLRDPVQSSWAGLERFLSSADRFHGPLAGAVDPNGNPTNSYLYDLVEKEDTEEMRTAHREALIKLGLSEENAKNIS